MQIEKDIEKAHSTVYNVNRDTNAQETEFAFYSRCIFLIKAAFGIANPAPSLQMENTYE